MIQIATIAIWAVTIFTFGVMLQAKQREQIARMRKVWLFSWSLSLFTTIELGSVYTAIDKAVEVNNFAWLLAYLSGAVAIYCLSAICRKEMPFWTFIYLALTLVFLSLIFSFGPAKTAETTKHLVPQNLTEVLFLETFYTYAATTMVFIPHRTFVRSYQREKDSAVRLRSFVALALLTGFITFYVIKGSVFLGSYLIPAIPFSVISSISAGLEILWTSVIILSPLGFIRSEFYYKVGQFPKVVKKFRIARDLCRLRARFDRLFPPIYPHMTRNDRINEIDLWIHQNMICIADAEKALEFFSVGNNDPALVQVVSKWSERDREEAIWLHQALKEIPDSLGYEQVVEAYRNLAKRSKSSGF